MTCIRLDEGEEFWCAGNHYRMLVPRDETHCLEAALETFQPGKGTPPNGHDTFVQLLIFFEGRAEVHIDGQVREMDAPGLAFVPLNTDHHVVNTGAGELKYVYVSIWPGQMPEHEDKPWKEVCARMIDYYTSRGFPPQ